MLTFMDPNLFQRSGKAISIKIQRLTSRFSLVAYSCSIARGVLLEVLGFSRNLSTSCLHRVKLWRKVLGSGRDGSSKPRSSPGRKGSPLGGLNARIIVGTMGLTRHYHRTYGARYWLLPIALRLRTWQKIHALSATSIPCTSSSAGHKPS